MLSLIPPQTTDLLTSLNEQLKPLVRREAVRWHFFKWPCVLVGVSAYVGLVFLFAFVQDSDSGILFFFLGLALYFGFFYILALIIGGMDDDFIRPLFNWVQKRTYLRAQIDYVNELISIEKEQIRLDLEWAAEQKEAAAIQALENISREISKRNSKLLSIEETIKHKRKWRSEFDEFPGIVSTFESLDRRARELISQHQSDIRPGHAEKTKWANFWFSDFGYRNYSWLKSRLESMKDGEILDLLPDASTRTLKNDLDEPAEETRKKDSETRLPRDPYATIRRGRTHFHPEDIPGNGRNASPPIASTQPSLVLDKRPLDEMPHQRPRLPRLGAIKISDALRQKIALKKSEIGKIGELAVIEFEQMRLQQEQNPLPIEHVSLKDDGAGYDVKSWDQDEQIYIEVKTTVGDFWSNLFFTENEFQTMLKHGESYRLYRICKFRRDTGEGKLFIYHGAEQITDTFEFTGNVYKLNQKN